jgi:hypothetical protein
MIHGKFKNSSIGYICKVKWIVIAITGLFSFASRLQAQTGSTSALGLGINRYGVAFHFKHYAPLPDSKRLSLGDWSFEIGNVQHPREVALLNNLINSSGVYKLEKVNYQWVFRPAWHLRSVVSTRPDRRSVGVNLVSAVGLPLAYHWPVYVTVLEVDQFGNENFSTVPYNPEIHPQRVITGRAGFTNGLSTGGITPGISLQTGLEFSWGNYRTDMNILGIGARVEAFAAKLPIMFNTKLNRSVLSSFYINFAFGLGN